MINTKKYIVYCKSEIEMVETLKYLEDTYLITEI